MTCETVGDLLLDYVEGELSPEQVRAVDEHLAQCKQCLVKYRATRALVGDLGAARSVEQAAWDSAPSHSREMFDQPAFDRQKRLGDFEIIEELGRGGMGVVYRARQLSLNRVVALKLLSTNLVQSARSISRFEREARAAARLHHTNIVPVYAQGREGDYFYYAMELIEGHSLDKVLREEGVGGAAPMRTRVGESKNATRLLSSATVLMRSAVSNLGLSRITQRHGAARDYKRIARLIAGVAEGLHHAHEQGVIHRDIKPQNLLLGPDDELHITDFGLARLLDEPGLTRSTEMVGTPAYMACEQITGPSTAIDRRTDVYSLGVTLYVMLTLRRPFEGETYEQTIHQILRREPKPPRKIDSRIPADLETICMRAIEKEPCARFTDAGELARDLRRWIEGFSIASRPVGPVGRAIKWTRRHPWRAGVIAALVALAIVVPTGLTFFRVAGNDDISRCEETLLDDYRHCGLALRQLGWVSRLGGDHYRYDFVRAFAYVRTEPERSVKLLHKVLEQRPDDRDAHYLLAWAYTRKAYTEGLEPWADAERQIDLGDALEGEVEASAAGWFFRGLAMSGFDPKQAERSYDEAIRRRNNFTQAMLHQGRAMNQIMYSLRDGSYYRKAVGQLEHVALGQRDQAYPRYLLATAHLLAAEIFQAEGKPAEAEEAYSACLKAARDAQMVEPESPRGYAIEATYYESRGDYAAAIEVWERYDTPAIRKSDSDKSERYAYQMRLHYWLGQYAAAERMRGLRYPQKAESHYDADESFYAALIAVGAARGTDAEQFLSDGTARVGHNPEYRLRLDAAYRLVGIESPAELLPQVADERCKLSPGWTPEWLTVLVRYQRAEVEWAEVVKAARSETHGKSDERLRLAGAFFFRGVNELAAGRRKQALTDLQECYQRRDNENYCFRAKMLLIKLQREMSGGG